MAGLGEPCTHVAAILLYLEAQYKFEGRTACTQSEIVNGLCQNSKRISANTARNSGWKCKVPVPVPLIFGKDYGKQNTQPTFILVLSLVICRNAETPIIFAPIIKNSPVHLCVQWSLRIKDTLGPI